MAPAARGFSLDDACFASDLPSGIGPCILNDKMTMHTSRFISFIYRYWYPVAASAE